MAKLESINAPVVSTFKGHKVLSIPAGEKKYPFSFGIAKAKAILEHIDDIAAFAKKADTEGWV